MTEKSTMKRPPRALVAVALLAVSGTSLYSQSPSKSQAVSPERSRAEETLEWWNQIGNKLIAMAKDFPEDKYDFKVQKDERTFAQNLLHVAAVDFDLAGMVSGSRAGPDFGKDKHNPSRDVYRTKDDVIMLLEQAVAQGAAVIKQQGDAGLDETRPFAWETGRHVVHNSYIWITGIEHSTEHFGQLVVYYRANNLVPPESRRDQERPAQQPSAPRVVELKVSDGTVLKASYFAAARPGPGVLLLHQSNRARDSWAGVARQLAGAGINTLTLDMRGFGESGGTPSAKLTDAERAKIRAMRPGDVDTAFKYLVSQPGVKGDVIGVGGAGEFGVASSVGVARQRSAEVKSLALLSGETLQDGLQFLRQASQLPGLFVVADDDEYPPTVEAMELLYITSSSPGKKFVHYSAAQDAPWIWYETSDASKVPANGGHGTDMFKVHPELPGIIVDWFVTTLIKTPGHAPADTIASAAIIDHIRMPGGVAQVTEQLMEVRRKDPEAQLFPEITVSIMGQDHMRAGEPKLAVEVLKLDLLAYPESADAHENLSEAYLADGQKVLARQHAEKALAILDSHTVPASSWTDTEQYRGEIRSGAQDVLKKLNTAR
jgi:dienelactone hydrolase/uncharacterized damage-inducible protein DinB